MNRPQLIARVIQFVREIDRHQDEILTLTLAQIEGQGTINGDEVPRLLNGSFAESWPHIRHRYKGRKGGGLFDPEVERLVGKRMVEPTEEERTAAERAFERLWAIWQVKKDKGKAKALFVDLWARDEVGDFGELLQRVAQMNQMDEQWSKGIGIPYLWRWLRDGRHRTDAASVKRTAASRRADSERGVFEAWR